METSTKAVLFVSDTALTNVFDNIKADAVIMPVGCYKPDEYQRLHCSPIQGFEMFNPMMYGDTLPNEISYKVLTVVIIATALVSLLAGVVPAVKACLMRPSHILRSQ